jgi:hypothetical protein
MKYLNKYNRIFEQVLNHKVIKDLTNDVLISLSDDGFDINFDRTNSDIEEDHIVYPLYINKGDGEFTISEIHLDVIDLLTRLNEINVDVLYIFYRFFDKNMRYQTIDGYVKYSTMSEVLLDKYKPSVDEIEKVFTNKKDLEIYELEIKLIYQPQGNIRS